jgi:hypothetical protein
MGEVEPLLDTHSLAERLNISPRLPADAAWRRRVGLVAFKVGGAVRFAPSEVQRWLQERREGVGAA